MNTWRITRTVDANGDRAVSPVGTFEGTNAKAVLILASRLDGCATFTGTEARGEFRWGAVCYRATPCKPSTQQTAKEALQRAKAQSRLSQFFPAPVR